MTFPYATDRRNLTRTESAGGIAIAAKDGEALGRSRGGLSTKIHLAVDGRGRPSSALVTVGQAGANPQLVSLPDAIRVHDGEPGRPRKKPDMVIADKAYAHDPTRRALRRRGIAHTIPERSDQVARRAAKGSRGGRPPGFDKQIYRQRNVVERCFNRLKQWRALATRYAERAALYRSSLLLIAGLYGANNRQDKAWRARRKRCAAFSLRPTVGEMASCLAA